MINKVSTYKSKKKLTLVPVLLLIIISIVVVVMLININKSDAKYVYVNNQIISVDDGDDTTVCQHVVKTTPASCTKSGSTYCGVCGVTLSTIPATGHSANSPSVTPPTCTTNGSVSSVTCKNCGAQLSASQTISALGHSCTETTGYTNKTATQHTPILKCVRCTKTENGTAENHTGATHTNGGKCTVCDYVYQAHSKGTVKEYTKTATGHTPVYACSYSGCTETYTGTAEKHNITTYADTGDGTHKGTCKDCSYEVVNAHTYSDGKCTVCNATEPKKDEQCEHTYVIKSDDNSHWEECSKCNNIKESTKSAHTISSWTDKQDGTHQGKCTVCQKVVIETHTNGTSGKCTKCSYDGTNSNNNNNNDNNNSNDNNNNDNNNGDNNGNNNNGSNNSGTNSGTTNKDNTTANGSIPQTGSSPILILTLVMLVSIVGFTVFKMNKIKDIK